MEIGLDNLQLFASMCRACNFFLYHESDINGHVESCLFMT